jgi:hypothetical protein
MGQKGKMSKADGRRSGSHEGYYTNLKPKIAKKKDRRVMKSSHGKFKSVLELEAHRRGVDVTDLKLEKINAGR